MCSCSISEARLAKSLLVSFLAFGLMDIIFFEGVFFYPNNLSTTSEGEASSGSEDSFFSSSGSILASSSATISSGEDLGRSEGASDKSWGA